MGKNERTIDVIQREIVENKKNIGELEQKHQNLQNELITLLAAQTQGLDLELKQKLATTLGIGVAEHARALRENVGDLDDATKQGLAAALGFKVATEPEKPERTAPKAVENWLKATLAKGPIAKKALSKDYKKAFPGKQPVPLYNAIKKVAVKDGDMIRLPEQQG